MDTIEFIKGFQDLYTKTPQISHWTRKTENCDYGDLVVVSKDCYLCFWSSNLEKCYYLHESRHSTSCIDCSNCDACELCYECTDCANCYNSNHLQDCKQCTDCEYCSYCIGCENCFGCAGLKRKKFHIFNQPYSEEEYWQKVSEIKKLPQQEIQKMFAEVVLKTPKVYMHQMNNQQCFGDYLYQSKNCYWCFDSYLCEDSMYIFNANLEHGTKDCLDCGPIANGLEHCYDVCFCAYGFESMHCYWCDYIYNCEWCINTWNSNHCFGAIYVKHKEYLILNKQYSKEEYEHITKHVSQGLKQLGIKDLYGLVHYQVEALKNSENKAIAQ